MSRGLGTVQRAAISEMEASRGSSLTVDQLCWAVAIRQGRCGAAWRGGGDQRDLPKSFYAAFRRAIVSLKRSGYLEIEPRKLGTLEEFVALYPSKTLSLQRRGLRERLLPHVATYLQNSSGRFTFAENEQFLARTVSRAAQSEWTRLETDVLLAASHSAGRRREILVQVLAKGRQYFDQSGISATDSLGQLVAEGLKTSAVPDERTIFAELAIFYGKTFPPRERTSLRLKNKLYEVARMGRGRRPAELTDELKMHLFRMDQALLESLPGHISLPGKEGWFVVNGHTFSPVLDQLIGRDVFRDFEFVRLLRAA